jgi:hypothetical protein
MEIFDKTFKLIQKSVETYISDSFDPIALLLCMHLIYRYQVIANKRNVPTLNKFHLMLIQLFESRFETVMKANIDSVQRVEPHKFSSIELNPHFVRGIFEEKNVFLLKEFSSDCSTLCRICCRCDSIK